MLILIDEINNKNNKSEHISFGLKQVPFDENTTFKKKQQQQMITRHIPELN